MTQPTTFIMPNTAATAARVRGMLTYSIHRNTTATVNTEETSWDRDWAMSCRRMSVSLV